MSSSAREVRKTVTILFCDLVHSTGLAEGDPEAYRRVQKGFFNRMREIVERHGGTVEKFIGDEVMAVFGVPKVHEDDALRAVRAAQQMQQALPELGLRARIGINTGEVLAGDPEHGLGLVAGEPVIVAKRLEQGAQSGEIVIGKATYPLVKHAVSAGPLERIPVKGKEEAVGRRRVDDVDREAPSLARRLDLPLVGRRDELRLLEEAFERAVEEQGCRLFTVLGPPGIGKSRLVAELATSLGERATTAVGRCLPYGEGITFWPLGEILGELGDLADAVWATTRTLSQRVTWTVSPEPRTRQGRARSRSGPSGARSKAARAAARSSSASRTCTGPNRRSSTSSSICSRGAATRRSCSCALPVPSSSSAARPGSRPTRAPTRSRSSRSPRARPRRCSSW